MTLKLTYAGFNYPAFYNGGYENGDALSDLQATGSNSAALEDEYGINTTTGQIVTDANFTDSIASLGSTITEAKADNQQVMVRPLIDLLDPSIDGGMTGDFRGYFYPTTPTQVNNFFSSYQSILVTQATAAQQAGASVFCLGTEIDQLTGPQFATQWDGIISAVKAVFTGKLTYSADWDDSQSPWQFGGAPVGTANIETQVSFWNQLDYVGIDEYAPVSDAANPTEAQLVAGWEGAPTDPNVAALTGGESLIQYYESLSADLGKPIFFTELGYEDATDAANSPFGSSTNVVDQPLQTELYQAFETAWQADGNTSLVGVNFWNWDPNVAVTAPAEGTNFSPQSNPSALSVIQNTFSEAESPACYCSGTRIRTLAGEVLVEDLAIGDIVVTSSGEDQPIIWVGHRRIDCRSHPRPATVLPVRVEAGAFGSGLPYDDLWLSPGHAVLVEGVLLPIERLINGATVATVPVDSVTYWHVELERHDIIIANGAPAESYLDTGNRTAFENGGDVLRLHPNFSSTEKIDGRTSFPMSKQAVTAARAQILGVAERLGYEMTADVDMHVVVDGVAISPNWADDDCYTFDLPPTYREAWLASPHFVPAQVRANMTDLRRLGVRVSGVWLDGKPVSVADLPDNGWHKPEAARGRFTGEARWTNGQGRLPSGARQIRFELIRELRAWVRRKASVGCGTGEADVSSMSTKLAAKLG
ncbi:Hint domain-containing protein [Acidisphaera sp. L21]|uniref:Hint domain-containing protein n=1 Tax=Acidisphaera sp. L21 TaxID=1641851 RepID=UPI00131B738F|nr:Hint domain-containing protein [Acidisphaera sp. L21]